MAIQITKIEKEEIEGVETINEYEVKKPYTAKDDYGNEAPLFAREVVVEEELLTQKTALLNELAMIDEKLAEIGKLK